SYSGELAERYAKLKLSGLDAAPCQFAVFADRDGALGHGLGRRTMPETAEYSVVAAICTMWLAARPEGSRLGWLSILDPKRMNAVLQVPDAWHFIGYFCLGYPAAEDDQPELERRGWEQRRAAHTFILRRGFARRPAGGDVGFAAVTFQDKYILPSRRIYLSRIHALVRVPPAARPRDPAARVTT